MVLEMPAELVARTRRPSGTTDLDSGLHQAQGATAGWRKART